MKKLVWMMVLLLMVTAGCQKTAEPGAEPSRETPPEVVLEEDPPEPDPLSEEEVVMAAFARLVEEKDPAAMGRYMDEHLAGVCPASAEYMVERLVIHHQGLAEEMNYKIYGEAYMTALNRDMGGVLDPDLIDRIEDPGIREEFRALADSKLRVVRYEETPVVETDWEALEKYKACFSEDFARMTLMNHLIQNKRRLYEEEGNKDLVSDILLTEELILRSEPGFLRTFLEELYKKQVSAFLVGPEGSYIGAFMDKKGPDYERIMSYKAAFEGHDLGDLVARLEALDTDDFSLIAEVITSHNVFGVHSEMAYIPRPLISGESRFTIARVKIPGRPELEEKINRGIDDTVNGLQSDISGNKTVFIHPTFGSEEILSLSISVSFSDDEGNYDYRGAFLVLDMTTGDRMTLADFLERPFEDYRDPLSDLAGATLETPPDFSVEFLGISLNLPREGSLFSDYYLLTAGELSDLVDYKKFFK